MKKSNVVLALLTIAWAGASVSADQLNAHPGPANNGGSPAWAIFFNLEAIGPGIKVTELTTASTAAAGAAFSVDVFTRPGTALGTSLTVGPGSSPDGWTLLGNAPATQGAVAQGVSLPIDIPDITVPGGSTVGVALRFVTAGPRYVTDTVYRTYEDALLRLVTGDSRSAPFTGTGSYFPFRTMVGSVIYELDGLGGAGSADPNPVPQSCNTLLSVNVSPDPGGSTGIQVVGNLSAFGGSGTQAFAETSPGSNVFTYNLAVPGDFQVGPITISTTVTDNESHVGSGNINLNVSPALTIATAATPTAIDPGQQTLLTVQINVPACATSTGHVVSADLTPIGGSVPQLFFDDGPGGGHGDAAAGDNIYSFLATVPPATPVGGYLVPVTVVDNQGHEVSGVISIAVGAFVEFEPNDTKGTATPVDCLENGQFILGTSTGATTTGTGALTSADNFRVKTCPAPLGIYRHRLTIESEITGHTGTIRGLTQTAGVINAGTDAVVQTSLTAASGDLPPRTVQWFGFGKEEEIYYRVTGAAATTESYTSTLSTTPVDPVLATQTYAPGNITIQRIAGSTTDGDFWVYDSGFNAIACLGMDDPEPGTLTANYPAGTYYIAMTNYNMANDQPSCPPNTFLTGIVMDFPNAVANSSSSTGTNIGISLTDGVNSEDIPLTKPGAFEVMFVRFTVGGSGCACPGDMNGDNLRNGGDVSGFVAAVIAATGNCADVNGDTTVTNDDVAPFTTLILAGTSCP